MRIFFGIIIGLVLAIGIAATAANYAFGSLRDVSDRDKSKDVTETFDLTGFDEIDVGGVFELDVTVGGDFSVVISGAPSEMERLEAGVENGVLKLDRKEGQRGKHRWRDFGLTAEITLPALTSVDIAGVADGRIEGVDADNFEIDLAGVGDLNIDGSCGRLDADVSGVGDLDAKGLECREVDIEVSGVGSASVYASEAVDASVSGIGSVDIYGSPSNVEKSSSFIASISVK